MKSKINNFSHMCGKYLIKTNKVMSKTVINSLLTGAMIIVMLGCTKNREKSADELLQDETMANEIMETISNDHEMMMNMMDHMKQSDHAMQLIAGNKGMMQHIMGNRQMMKNMMMQDSAMTNMIMGDIMEMMEQDSVFCNRMSIRMGGNKHMINTMMNMMHQKGMKMGEGKEKENMHMQMHRHGDM